MKRFTCFLVLAFSSIAIAQDVSTYLPAAGSMQATAHGNRFRVATPAVETVEFHAQGIELSLRTGEGYTFHFESKSLGTLPEMRKVAGKSEIWYPRLYPNIDLRCYIKADGEVGYDWKMGTGADPAEITMTMEKKVAQLPASSFGQFVSLQE